MIDLKTRNGISQKNHLNSRKSLLAYSSIENISIIGTGLGLDLIGLALKLPL